MKTTMTISVDKELKNAFSNFSKQIWTNPTNLINMLMVNTINTRQVKFWSRESDDFEIEAFSEDEINSFSSEFIEKTNENTKKLEKLLANI
jgi:antitoxin component of RelBE/YafQ-DinJ toxin-antitoxin module